MRFVIAAALACAAAPIAAQSPFDGTWRFDPATMQADAKPDTWTIGGGTFHCATCIPELRVAADGRFHKVAGRPYWDEIKVDASRPDRVAYSYRRRGKLVATNTETLSADGATLTSAAWSINNASAKPIESTATLTRLSPAPAGTHATSGSWRRATQAIATLDAARLTFRIVGDAITVTESTGETVTGRIDGPPVLNRGDPGRTLFAYRRPEANVLEEASMRDGKEIGVTRYTVAPDGRTLTSTYTDKRNGRVTSVTATKD